MPDHPTVTSQKGRTFACFPAAVLIFLVNPAHEFLLLSHPRAGDNWEVPNGALEAGESIRDGALRELAEEAGPDVRARPLGVVHTYTHYLHRLQIVSICYLAAYDGGEIVPGGDMAGSRVRWATPADAKRGDLTLIVPTQPWLPQRAVELYLLWNTATIPPLEKDAHPGDDGSKYDKP